MKLFGVSFILATAVAFLAYGAELSLAAETTNLRNPSVLDQERELGKSSKSSKSSSSSKSSKSSKSSSS